MENQERVWGSLKTLGDSAGQGLQLTLRSRVPGARADWGMSKAWGPGPTGRGRPGGEGQELGCGVPGEVPAPQKLGLCFLSSTMRW